MQVTEPRRRPVRRAGPSQIKMCGFCRPFRAMRGRFWICLAPIALSSALGRLAAPGPSFWKGNILGIKACSPSGLSCSPTLFNRLAGTTEYVLYNNGVEDPQRYGWATDRGILEGSSDPQLSAPGLQQVGLRKSSSGFCGRPILQHWHMRGQHGQLVDHKSRQARPTSLAREQL